MGVWCDPVDSFQQLRPWIQHYHFKNISSADYLHVFEPNNVYAAAEIVLVWFHYLKAL